MFSGNRRFDGRQGEQILNEEQYTIYEILKHFLDVPDNPDPKKGPVSGLEKAGALWLDRQTSPGNGRIMYKDNDNVWKPIFDDWFKLIKEIRYSDGVPENPREGQLWINDAGVMHWYNGSVFIPIKASLADSIDFNANSFQNFLMIDPLKMSGGYIIENLSKLAQLAGSITEWQPNTRYNADAVFYYVHTDKEVLFYRSTKDHTSELLFADEIANGNAEAVELKAQYLIPSETLDKVFIDGRYTERENNFNNSGNVYEKLSDVCIQISLNVYNGKTVAAVHVNPIALKNIKKRIIKIEKDASKFNEYGMVKVGPENTEYYGFKGSHGQLLLKGEDYITKANGIQLITTLSTEQILADKCDFDNDGVVTEMDLDLIKSKYNSIEQVDLDLYDLNNDGIIDIEDVNIVSKNIGHVVGSGTISFNEYDFVYCVTYEFENRIKTQGTLSKKTINLSNKMSIWVGDLEPSDKLLIFTQGMCLEDFYYSYDRVTELVNFNAFDENGNITDMPERMVKPLFQAKTDVAIFRFDKKTNIDILTPEKLENSVIDLGEVESFTNNGVLKARVPIPEGYLKPLVFVQGVNLNFTLGDYTIENGYAVIDNAVPGSAYYIVDAVRKDGFDMYVGTGAISRTKTITVTDEDILSGKCKPLVFVDGFYISSGDLNMDDPRYIKISGMKEGQEYVLLKDMQDSKYQLLYDGTVAFTTIPMEHKIDDALVYVGSSLLVDGGICYTTSTSGDGICNNEIKLIFTNEIEKWCSYNESKKAWEPITNKEFITTLDMASSGYSVDEKVINILQNFGDVNCTYYAYRFADNIEKPLQKGYAIESINKTNELFYKIDREHSYTPGTNSLHVWINGVKQRVKEDDHYINIDGFTKKFQGFTIPYPTNENGEILTVVPTPYYVIEEPEANEVRSSNVEYITESSGVSTFTTKNILLSPGIPRLFIDGYRQPQNSYVINNMNTITIIDPVLTVNNPTYMVTDYDGDNHFFEPKQKSEIAIEVRQDYTLKEKTIVLTEENMITSLQGGTFVIDKGTVFKDNAKLPIDIFLAPDSEINIFINGANYGKNFEKIKNQDIIILSNADIVSSMRAGDYITFEWR